mmetsp:Transcript_20324/g.40312  ORF Transcript_20324/g.40312 Transcript_20324/m.40312 type:complete len:209 (+) Transcript_20324:242-868(+)
MKKQEAQEDVKRALRSAFLLTDIQTSRFVTDTSGSTGVCCLLRRNTGEGNTRGRTQIFVANCGDSRAVLATGGGSTGERLSHDHKGECLVEQQRIARLGGFTHSGRTLGVLAVSRSFGDHAFKDFVTADPYVASRDLESPEENPFLIVCCDGVWDVISDDEAVAMVKEAASKDLEGAWCSGNLIAKALVDEATRRGSGDNLSAVVVFF